MDTIYSKGHASPLPRKQFYGNWTIIITDLKEMTGLILK
jgi:hypothetical protein